MKIILLLLGFICSVLVPSPQRGTELVHEFHLSKCQIEYSEQDQALQIMMHIYLDDLEEALRKQGADKLHLCTEKEVEKAETYLFRYLQQQFQLVVNGQPVTYEFVGKEQSEDLQAVWCYLEVIDVKEVKSVEVTYSLLMEIFDDQKNIFSISVAKNQEGYFLFQKGKETDTVTFD